MLRDRQLHAFKLSAALRRLTNDHPQLVSLRFESCEFSEAFCAQLVTALSRFEQIHTLTFVGTHDSSAGGGLGGAVDAAAAGAAGGGVGGAGAGTGGTSGGGGLGGGSAGAGRPPIAAPVAGILSAAAASPPSGRRRR